MKRRARPHRRRLREVLLERARNGGPVLRVHAAALSLYLAGKAKERFDWEQRPFFLQFGEEDPAVRERVYAELRGRRGIKADSRND